MKEIILLSINKLDNEMSNYVDEHFSMEKKHSYSLIELKRRGIIILIKTLFSFRTKDDIIFIFNDELYKTVESFLYVLSLITFKLRIKVLTPDKSLKIIRLNKRIGALPKLLFSHFQIKKLEKKVYHDVKRITDKNTSVINNDTKIFYIKTNIGLGNNVGGSVGHIAGVVNALAKRSNVFYFAFQKPVMINNTINKYIFNLDNVDFTFPYELNRLLINKAIIDKSKEILKKIKPDLIYQRLTLNDYSGAYISNLYNIPLIVEYNGSEVWIRNNWGRQMKYSKLGLILEDYVLKSANIIVTVSKVLKEELIQRGYDKNKIVFYPNCIDRKVFDYKYYDSKTKLSLRKRLGYNENDKIFTFIGTFGAWHGVEFLANAIAQLVKKNKKEIDRFHIRFLIIGDGLLGAKVRGILSDNQYKKYVKFTGIIPQKEAPTYLSISDCFLSPHIKQKGKFIGSPTKLFEYMSFAKPIIASNVDQVSEIFENKVFAKSLKSIKEITNESAIIFEPENYHEFINSILYVAESKEDNLTKLGNNAYQMVMKKYTWETHVEKIIEKYNETCLQVGRGAKNITLNRKVNKT